MDRDLLLLLQGAILGLSSGFVIELFKHHLERKRAGHLVTQAEEKRQTERVHKFLRGESAAARADQAPYPAWLRQITVAQRNPLAQLGLRSDEDFKTGAYRVREPSSRPPLLKTFRRRRNTNRPPRRKGGKFLLGPSHLIGRGSLCDIQVLDPAVSLIHALIRFEGDNFVLYDLGSTGGTFVGGEPVGIAGRPLDGGETISMGDTSFEFGRVTTHGELDQVDNFLVL